MVKNNLSISKGIFSPSCLKDKTILIIGGGGGIGFEAARSLVWLGANVVIAEIDKDKGKQAEQLINNEFHTERAYFFPTDISRENDINRLSSFLKKNLVHWM